MLRNKTFSPEFCSLVSNWFDEGANSRDKSVARVCFRSKLPWYVLKFACRDMTCLQLANQIGLFFSSTTHCQLTFKVLMPQIGLFHHSSASSCPSCVLVGVLTRERVSGLCFRSKLPRVYRHMAMFTRDRFQMVPI